MPNIASGKHWCPLGLHVDRCESANLGRDIDQGSKQGPESGNKGSPSRLGSEPECVAALLPRSNRGCHCRLTIATATGKETMLQALVQLGDDPVRQLFHTAMVQ